MPGVGVAPGLKGFFSSDGSGMPGVGVAPFGRLFAAAGSGIPGVEFPDGGTGLVERPGGKLFASTGTGPMPALLFALTFVSVADPQAEAKSETDKTRTRNKTFDINSKPLKFKITVPA